MSDGCLTPSGLLRIYWPSNWRVLIWDSRSWSSMMVTKILVSTSTRPKQPLLATNSEAIPDSKVHGANMGPTWVLSAPDGPHVGRINLVIRDHKWSVFLRYNHWTNNSRVTCTENGDVSWYQLCFSWWHLRLSQRQPPVPPMPTELASWQLSHFF